MATKRLVFNFPPHLLDQPITCQLIRNYDVMVNILRGRIIPRERGRLVVEISGKKRDLEAGLRFVTELGVDVQPLAQDIQWHEDRCIECTACTSLCPSGALSVAGPEMRVSFDRDKCIACEMCVPACPYKAMEIVF
jgi:ferredoxin